MNKHYEHCEGYEPHEFPPDYQGKFFLEWQMNKMYESGFDWALNVLLFVLGEETFPISEERLLTIINSLKEGESVRFPFKEYEVIKEFYGGHAAKRSGVPLMNHIIEGCHMLSQWGRPDYELGAFCLHPIVQNSESIDVTWSESYPLACEYRDKANAYLCREENDWITTSSDLSSVLGDVSTPCLYLLLADKVQNQKDFLIYHSQTHSRRKELRKYFSLWIEYILEQLDHAKPI